MGSMSLSESESVYTCRCVDIPQVIKCEDDQDSIIIKVSYVDECVIFSKLMVQEQKLRGLVHNLLLYRSGRL